jgi:hypothetical protein
MCDTDPAAGDLITKELTTSRFFCPDCGRLIEDAPLNVQEDADTIEPVTSLTLRLRRNRHSRRVTRQSLPAEGERSPLLPPSAGLHQEIPMGSLLLSGRRDTPTCPTACACHCSGRSARCSFPTADRWPAYDLSATTKRRISCRGQTFVT